MDKSKDEKQGSVDRLAKLMFYQSGNFVSWQHAQDNRSYTREVAAAYQDARRLVDLADTHGLTITVNENG